MNHFGQITQYTLGNNRTTNITYDPINHFLKSIETQGVQNFVYDFNPTNGNLNKRTINNITENFTYDNLNRLTSFSIANNNVFNINYASNGNILQFDSVGTYNYSQTKPNAVVNIEGNYKPAQEQNISYTSFNKVSQISEGQYRLDIVYNASQQRKISKLYKNNQLEKTKYFFGKYEKEITPEGEKHINYIFAPTGLVAMYITTNNQQGQMYYVYSDHQGSITEITNHQGTLLQRFTYTPWGSRQLTLDNTGTGKPLTDRGYTAHEHLPEFSLVNMNGRVYDPQIGRFLSPDNYVQAPDFSQSFNRYSYCLNNPLKYTDPSGEMAWLIPIAIGVGIAAGGVSGYYIGQSNGATNREMYGYVLGGMLIGGLSGVAAAGISAAGGGAMLAGAGAGMVGGAGFSGLSTSWDTQAMLKGATIGAVSGLVGGGFATAIGGGWGALAGGAASNITGQLLSNGGDFGSVNWTSVVISGAASYVMYQGVQYLQYIVLGRKLGLLNASYEQYSKTNTAYQKSRFWHKEYGLIYNKNKTARFVPHTDRHKFDVTLTLNLKEGDFATAHTHWAKEGVDWVDIGGTGLKYQRYEPSISYPEGSEIFTTVGGYHSPQDLNIPGYSLVVGRSSSTYSLGIGTYDYINPDPFVRFFLFFYNQ